MMEQDFYETFLQRIRFALDAVSYTEKAPDNADAVAAFTPSEGLERLCAVTHAAAGAGGRVFILGNGASNALAAAIALEFALNASVDAVSFTSSAYLTAVNNDDGGASLFTRALQCALRPADLLVAISSSGKSPNILSAIALAAARGCRIATFSAMREDNPARLSGGMNFYVPISTYSGAETAHYALLQMWHERYMAAYLPERLPEKYENRRN
ncbi:MAG: SIS domain-containing protein [Deltaproteobacteria bacterium]|jgi:D-sedoheptulose 7-phosphate isomerase|nr:SIS domain-containing protein [Deltaproteobacteria bacterium]